jgi:hypothetical protein
MRHRHKGTEEDGMSCTFFALRRRRRAAAKAASASTVEGGKDAETERRASAQRADKSRGRGNCNDGRK